MIDNANSSRKKKKKSRAPFIFLLIPIIDPLESFQYASNNYIIYVYVLTMEKPRLKAKIGI